MAKVRLTTPDQQPWQSSRQSKLADPVRGRLAEGEQATEFKIREQGSETLPQLVELRYPPHNEIQLHSHDNHEIIYVLSGQMLIGNRTYEAGACLAIDGGVIYGFRAGPEGLHILNFRPCNDTSFNLPPRRGITAN